jgi:hypothetical protein
MEKIRIDGLAFPSDLIQWLEISKFGKFLHVNSAYGQWHRHKHQASESISRLERSTAFYQSVSSWQSRNLSMGELPAGFSISLLRSIQIGIKFEFGNTLNSLETLKKLINLHNANLDKNGIARLNAIIVLLKKTAELVLFKVRNA